jgi:hypothetical protein
MVFHSEGSIASTVFYSLVNLILLILLILLVRHHNPLRSLG